MDQTPSSKTVVNATISPYLDQAREHGLEFREMVGLTVKRATRLGIDVDALGQVEDGSLDDEIYYEQTMTVAWLLAAPEEAIASAIRAGNVPGEVEKWQSESLPSLALEAIAMRCFMARWLEYRVEMDRVFSKSDEPTPAAGE